MPIKKGNEYDPEEWDIVATQRINKNINMNEMKNYEDYHQALLNLFMTSHDKQGRFTGRNIINSNRPRKKFDDIVNIMYNASVEAGQLTPQKKRTFMSLYSVYEAKNTHVSSKGKVYTQTQYQDLKGRFTKNPFK